MVKEIRTKKSLSTDWCVRSENPYFAIFSCSHRPGDKIDHRGDFWENGFFDFHDHLPQSSHGWVEGL